MTAISLFDERRLDVMLAGVKRWNAQPPTGASTFVSPSQQARFDACRANLLHAGELQV